MEISSYSNEIGFALTNPIFISPKGYLWLREWTSSQLFWRKYMQSGIIYNDVVYVDVEEAYQKNKNNFSTSENDLFNKSRFDLMVELICIKLKTYPWLMLDIDSRGGIEFLKNCTHNPTKKKTYWETDGQNKFILALCQAYLKVKENVN